MSMCCCCRSAPICRTSSGTKQCRSSGSPCWCWAATPHPRSSSPSSRRHASWNDPTCSRSRRGPRPKTRWRSSRGSWATRAPRPSATPRGPVFLVDLLARTPHTSYRRASTIIGPLRAVKDAVEIDALRRVGAAVDRIAAELQAGHIPLVGRTEADVLCRARCAHARRGPSPRELRHRGRGGERGEPASRGRSPCHPRGRGRAVRFRWFDARWPTASAIAATSRAACT